MAATTGSAAPTGEVRVHKVPRLRWAILLGIALAFAVSFQQITQPDYNTHTRARPADWLWVVLPGLVILGFIGVRVWRSRIEASPEGIRVVRVTESELVPWDQLAGIEVRPTQNRWGTVISARRTDRRVVRLGTVPGRTARHAAKAQALKAQLEADRARFAPE